MPTTSATSPACNVQILIPSGRGVWPVDFTMSLLSMVMHTMQTYDTPGGMALNCEVVQSSTLQMGRETLVKRGLANGATHLLFLDDDHTFPADTLLWLLKRNLPVVAANYVRRMVGGGPVTIGTSNQPVYTRPESSGLQRVRFSGLGVAMIHADVFRQVPEPWFDFEWGQDPETGEWIIVRSEDVYMFDKLAEHGFYPYIDHDLSKHVEHIGVFNYSNFHGLPQTEQMRRLQSNKKNGRKR